ncbi:MAG: right-handed parallel beta-helix repeat-containing protein, partial [Chloroflexaceae bacterium]|nr:right-handed parallel beta-helix repeat-containing protein [Chloroflexaceae bacterium]
MQRNTRSFSCTLARWKRSVGGGVGIGLLAVFAYIGLLQLAPTPAYAQAGTVYYVSPDGDDTNDGLSWATAFANLQTALAVASDGAEIWVAAGTYYPDEGTGQVDNVRSSTFALIDGVAIYGGFAGDEALRSERDPATNGTILSGDLDQSGDITANDAYHVVSSNNNTVDTVLDGFTITGGNADATDPNNRGGGIFTQNSSTATFTNVTISGNVARDGGGIYNDNSNPTFTNVAITGNTAQASGGGIYNVNGSSPTFTNVTISG